MCMRSHQNRTDHPIHSNTTPLLCFAGAMFNGAMCVFTSWPIQAATPCIAQSMLSVCAMPVSATPLAALDSKVVSTSFYEVGGLCVHDCMWVGWVCVCVGGAVAAEDVLDLIGFAWPVQKLEP